MTMEMLRRATALVPDAARGGSRAGRSGASRVGQCHGRRDERGDVPGWVLITLMTAGLVTALWAVARGELLQIFSDALHSVTG